MLLTSGDRTAWASGGIDGNIGQLGDGILGVVVGTAILLNGETSHLVLGTQFAEFLASDFRIRATVAVIVGVVTVFVFVFFIFVFVGRSSSLSSEPI